MGLFGKKNEEGINFEKTTKYGSLSIDEHNRLFKTGVMSGVFKFEDLVSFELIEDNQKITEGGISLGRAAVGAVAFGTAGAAISGLSKMKKNDKEICSNMQIVFTVRNNKRATNSIILIATKTDKSKGFYKQAQVNAKAILEGFNYIIEQNAVTIDPAISNYEELKKLKELLDLGILSQEEFEKKKAELL